MKFLLYICLLAALVTVSFAGSACNNTADITVFQKDWKTFSGTLRSCGKGCFGGESCSSRCMQAKTDISENCADCFGASIHCIAKHCLMDCINPYWSKCVKCAMKYCVPALETCTGCTLKKTPGECQLPPN